MTVREQRLDDEAPVALAIDTIRCDGHGICAWLFPDRITLDRWGFPLVDRSPVAHEDRNRAMRAVRACPRAALIANTVPAARTGATVQP